MRRYAAHLDRIDEWMRDIQRCFDPGPYDRRCENAYGSPEPGDAEQAREAMRTVGEVRRALEGVPERRRAPPALAPPPAVRAVFEAIRELGAVA